MIAEEIELIHFPDLSKMVQSIKLAVRQAKDSEASGDELKPQEDWQ